MHKIVVKILPNGKTEVSVDGLHGASCKDATKAIEAALGKVVDDKKTSEYHKVAKVDANLRQEGS